MAELIDWDILADNNNSAPPDGWPEGTMNYDEVNDSARENMAVLARYHKDNIGQLVSAGPADAYTLTPNQTVTAYYNGLSLLFQVNQTNTGPSTLDVSGVGPAPITRLSGAPLGAGDMQGGGKYQVIYDGTAFQLVGAALSATSAETISGDWKFTGGLALEGTAPAFDIFETGVTADNGRWQLLAEAEGLQLRLGNDAGDTWSNLLVVARTGLTVDSVAAGGPWAFTGLTSLAGGLTATAGAFSGLVTHDGAAAVDMVAYSSTDTTNDMGVQFTNTGARWTLVPEPAAVPDYPNQMSYDFGTSEWLFLGDLRFDGTSVFNAGAAVDMAQYSSNDTTNDMGVQFTNVGTRWTLVPEPAGVPDYPNQLSYDFGSNAWFFQGAVEFGGNVGFYGAAPAAKPTITGSRGGNAALADLLSELATLGLITDSTTA